MDAAKEEKARLVQDFGDGLIRREHELLDDLMALRVLDDMGARHAAILVEIDLDLLHRQFERPAAEPSGPQDHRQLVHPAEQVVHLARQLATPSFAIR